MASKKTKYKQIKSNDASNVRRTRWIRIVLIGFSIILILSLVLSLAATTS